MFEQESQRKSKGAKTSGIIPHILVVLLYLAPHLAAFAQSNIAKTTIATDSVRKESTITGTVRDLAKDKADATLTIDAPQGPVTVNLGSGLSNSMKKKFAEGSQVQATGIIQNINGVQSMQARLVAINGHQVTLRNSHGFAMHQHMRAQRTTKQTNSNGGAL